jgi:hypothetical protein
MRSFILHSGLFCYRSSDSSPMLFWLVVASVPAYSHTLRPAELPATSETMSKRGELPPRGSPFMFATSPVQSTHAPLDTDTPFLQKEVVSVSFQKAFSAIFSL